MFFNEHRGLYFLTLLAFYSSTLFLLHFPGNFTFEERQILSSFCAVCSFHLQVNVMQNTSKGFAKYRNTYIHKMEAMSVCVLVCARVCVFFGQSKF